MKNYDELTGEEILNPDLSAGYLYNGRHPDDGGISYAGHGKAETLVSEIVE